MTYAVQLSGGGYTGWKLLERTGSAQRAVLARDPQIERSVDYFSEKMPAVATADELVSDYKLLTVALRAFGLDADAKNRLFIRKVLEADPDDSSSLVNKLTDKRYLALNKALGLNQTSSAVEQVDVAGIADLYVIRSFEKNVGERYPEIELALNAQRELPALAGQDSSATTKWFQIIGSKSLRKIFDGAFGLDTSFARLPVDRQAAELGARLEKMTGSADPGQFSDSAKVGQLIKTYLLRSQTASSTPLSPYAAALTILGG